MSLHTFVIDGRKRLQISQSKTEPGKVLVQVLDAARDVLVSCTMDAETAGVVSQALELEAVAAENVAQCSTAARPGQDPKYDFQHGKIWNRNGGYYLPDDEPVMVLRGKDQACLAAIFGYIECLEKQAQTKHVMEHIGTARERLNAFFVFQNANPERSGIGCTVAEKLQVTTQIFGFGKVGG